MPNLRNKTWTPTTPANVTDAQFWEDHLVPDGGTTGQVLTKLSGSDQDATWAKPASSGHIIQDEDGNDMTQEDTLQFINADVTNDSVNGKTVVDCKGSKGDAATVTVGTVTTLPAGSNATVTNSGTTSAAVFDFGIPKGDPGTGNPVWGNITGTLANQTDLATALGSKYDTADTAETTIDDADYIPFYDSSATAKRKSLWSNIKSVLKTYFDGIYLVKKCTGEITTAGTDVTITDASITANSTISTVCSNIANDAYISITPGTGSCVVKFATSAVRKVSIYVDNRT